MLAIYPIMHLFTWGNQVKSMYMIKLPCTMDDYWMVSYCVRWKSYVNHSSRLPWRHVSWPWSGAKNVPREWALGIRWNVFEDQFEIKTIPVQKPMTQHGVLSIIYTIFYLFSSRQQGSRGPQDVEIVWRCLTACQRKQYTHAWYQIVSVHHMFKLYITSQMLVKPDPVVYVTWE